MFTPQEVAEYFQVNLATVYRWIRSGKLRADKIGDRLYRISAMELQRFKSLR